MRSTVRFHGHVRIRIIECKGTMIKRVYQSNMAGVSGRDRHLVSLEGKVEQYLQERIGGRVWVIGAGERTM